MTHERNYEVLLLPTMEIAERFCTLREAEAWMRSYNDAARGPTVAVVAEDREAREVLSRRFATLQRR